MTDAPDSASKDTSAASIDAGGGVDAARWFLERLPVLAGAHGERARLFPALAQTACVIVEREAFTLRLHEGEVVAGADVDAPFHLWLSRAAFASLVRGDVDAVRPPQVGYRGDLKYLDELGRLLRHAGSSVFARVSKR